MRILIDSNVWRYVVDSGGLARVRTQARRSPHRLVVAPAVLYEAYRCDDPHLRRELVNAITDPAWTRLMPEAYSESQELLGEVARARPYWMRLNADAVDHRKNRHDWRRSKGGLWDRARNDPDAEARRAITPLADEAARAGSRELREWGKRTPADFQRKHLDELRGRFPEAVPGWDGEDFEPWRQSAMVIWLGAARGKQPTYAQWVQELIQIDHLGIATTDLLRFWLREVNKQRMPRHWIRDAFYHLQSFHKVNDGTPMDAQIASYLVDADVVVSADKNFVKIAQRCAQEAPFRVATPSLAPAGAAAVESLIDALRAPKPNAEARLR